MKKNTVIILAFYFAIVLAGCAGHINMRVERDGKGLTYSATNINLLGPAPPSPESGASAYATMAMADSLVGYSATGGTQKFFIGIVNNDPVEDAYCYHPELPGMAYTFRRAGGYGVIPVTSLPSSLTIYRADGSTAKVVHPQKNYDHPTTDRDVVLGGFKVDVRYTISRLR